MDRLLLLSRDPHDHIAEALSGTRHGSQPVDHRRVEPYETVAISSILFSNARLPSGSVRAIASNASTVMAILIKA